VKSSIVNGFVKDNGEDCGKEEASLLVAVNRVKVSKKEDKNRKSWNLTAMRTEEYYRTAQD
jgi:hypothetical protein